MRVRCVSKGRTKDMVELQAYALPPGLKKVGGGGGGGGDVVLTTGNGHHSQQKLQSNARMERHRRGGGGGLVRYVNDAKGSHGFGMVRRSNSSYNNSRPLMVVMRLINIPDWLDFCWP